MIIKFDKVNRGFSLVELLVVMAILAILTIMMVSTLDPAGTFGKAYDGRRKRDLGKIRVAFEEYYNDKGCYPDQNTASALSCNSNDFSPWLKPWPCDPKGTKYYVITGTGCPQSFRVLTLLESKTDREIPSNWGASTITVSAGGLALTNQDFNFGVSSSNVKWAETVVNPICLSTPWKGCYHTDSNGGCNVWNTPGKHYSANLHYNCIPECAVDCCENGEVCN